MKVLYIAHSFGLQGAGFALLNILKEIKQKGIDIAVVLPGNGDMYEKLNELGISCLITRYYPAIYPPTSSIKNWCLFLPRLFRTVFFNALSQKKILYFARKNHIDIIHTNSGVIHFGVKIAEKYSIPHIWHIREFQDINFGYMPIGGVNGLRRKIKLESNHCIAITKAIFEYFNMCDKKDFVIYDGVFSDLDKAITDYNKLNYFLFVGSLQKGKGIFEAILAFETIASEYSNCELWLVGKDLENINKYVGKSVYKDRIKLLGFRTDIYELMSKAKALLVPSFSEGFGFITAEAMINSCLVIGRNTGGTKEQFDNGLFLTGNEIGLRFNDISELVESMRHVCANSFDDMRPMIIAAKNTASNYTIENSTREIISLYNSIYK